MLLCACSGPLDKATTRTVRPVAVDQDAAACTSASHYHHQGCTFNATILDCRCTQSPKPARHREDVTEKSGPTQETATRAPSTSELAVILHHPFPLNRPQHYQRDGTFPMNVCQSCINCACCSPAVDATATGQDAYDYEPLLHFTTVPEQESLRGYEGHTELAF